MIVKELKEILSGLGKDHYINMPASEKSGVMVIYDEGVVRIIPTDDMKTVGELLEDLLAFDDKMKVHTVFDDGEDSNELYLWWSKKFGYVHIDATSNWDEGLEHLFEKLN